MERTRWHHAESIALSVGFIVVGITGCQSSVLRPESNPGPRGQMMMPSGPQFPNSPATNGIAPSGSSTNGASNSGAANWDSVKGAPASQLVPLPTKEATNAAYHTVVQGESWSAIASRYQLTAEELSKANGLTVNSKLEAGQMLYLPPKVK